MNVIVIASLALIVLALLSVFILIRVGWFDEHEQSTREVSDLNCTELRDYFENGRQCTLSDCKYPGYTDGYHNWKVDIIYWLMVKNCTG